MNINNNYSAGILLFTKHEGTKYYLLGRSNEDKWSDFGGHSEIKDHNDPVLTATREFYEESLGCLCDFELIKRKIKNNKFKLIISKTRSGYTYYMYHIYIKYSDEYRIRFHCTKNYMKNVLYNNKLEINDIRWISKETLIHSIEDKTLITLRPVFLNTIKNNYNLIFDSI